MPKHDLTGIWCSHRNACLVEAGRNGDKPLKCRACPRRNDDEKREFWTLLLTLSNQPNYTDALPDRETGANALTKRVRGRGLAKGRMAGHRR